MLEEEDRSVRLRGGKGGRNQLFVLEGVGEGDGCWIRCVSRPECALSM